MIAHKHKHSWIAFIGIVSAALISIIGYFTAKEWSFYLFYFPFIILVSWFSGRLASFLMAIFCTLGWFWATVLGIAPRPSMLVLFWNSWAHFVTFLFIAWAVTKLKKKEEELLFFQRKLQDMLQLERNRSREDALTGAMNLRGFEEKLSEERSRSKRYEHVISLLYFDLDHFKEQNDLHGHAFGDELLRKIVMTIKEIVRASDTIARVGGDEFCVMLPETHQDGAKACAEKIMQALQKKIFPSTTVSIGLATFSKISDTNEEMIRCVDQAMYEAKKMGRARVCVADPNKSPADFFPKASH